MKTMQENLLLTTCLGAALLAVACSGTSASTQASGKGRIQIAMTSGSGPTASAVNTVSTAETPKPELKSANITLSSIQARAADGSWVDVLISLPTTIDLVAIRDGKTIQLPAGLLPPGTYDRLMVTITQVDIVLTDDTQIAITPPPGGWTVQIPAKPFEIVEGQPTSVSLRFREDLSFRFAGGTMEFRPEFECED